MHIIDKLLSFSIKRIYKKKNRVRSLYTTMSMQRAETRSLVINCIRRMQF